MAKFLIEQYGGADGELAAASLSEPTLHPADRVIGIVSDFGTEELAHLEMIATMVYKLTKDATAEEMKEAGLGAHYADHDKALYFHNAAGVPSPATSFRPRGIRSQICTKISRRRRKPGPPTNG